MADTFIVDEWLSSEDEILWPRQGFKHEAYVQKPEYELITDPQSYEVGLEYLREQAEQEFERINEKLDDIRGDTQVIRGDTQAMPLISGGTVPTRWFW